MDSLSVMRSPSAERNKDPILNALKKLLPTEDPMTALEIASGTGQHVAYFAEHLQNVTWQPSECDQKSLNSIDGYIRVSSLSNIRFPVWIDATEAPSSWAKGCLAPASFDLVLCINMLHVSLIAATQGLFNGCGNYLKAGGTLVTYGPYNISGNISPESNVELDRMLRQQNNEWGLRDTDDLRRLAEDNSMTLINTIDMPSNNKILVFKKN
ncbi:hypothetical protein CAPTEDRAFT_111852 [Capitella teleta]|uniref:Methyltransferase-like 26 n=1 Tax=Capitella teleta TaxID=283909 RepID=X1YV66_CAPTE|nr:hypothetical protein CAPTEDRAFT_111852 [Capitella teleta]|eukprot:ELU04730.1 hypothetical protein CAPTEDRAFT_111852 [Capitella teleta]